MDFDRDVPFNPDDYVQPGDYPDGATVRECRFCGGWVVVPTGEWTYPISRN